MSLNHENGHQYAGRNDTVAVYVLHILLVRAVRDIRFGHAIRLCRALCVSSDRVYRVQAQKPGAGISGPIGITRRQVNSTGSQCAGYELIVAGVWRLIRSRRDES